ncbi:ESX secretion-associated protein EspG [Kutzneria albida]|uniref:ESX secretion-associated protein EspG n=1 Tax=Kutzneria albida DSM 43870 TaxID=1449976 RepID=W5WDA3_9PSEU|nr:ESX secretion-associated protein EspG [Kutzneria albida]AHH98566.1 hypothetical protein KALB_5204 [Kutzneria albida DSM 43870]
MAVIKLDYAELGVAWQRSRLPALPAILTWRNHTQPPTDPQHALEQAEARLRARSLLDRHLDDDLYGALTLIAHASFELDLRYAPAPGRELRACVTARAGHAVRFLVDGDQVRIDTIPDHAVTSSLLGLLPAVPPAPGHTVSLPTAELEAAVTEASALGEVADAAVEAGLRARGIRSDVARTLTVLAGSPRTGYGTFGAAVRDSAGVRRRGQQPVKVLDTDRGRVAMYPRSEYTVVAPASTPLLGRVLDELVDGLRHER